MPHLNPNFNLNSTLILNLCHLCQVYIPSTDPDSELDTSRGAPGCAPVNTGSTGTIIPTSTVWVGTSKVSFQTATHTSKQALELQVSMKQPIQMGWHEQGDRDRDRDRDRGWHEQSERSKNLAECEFKPPSF